MHSARCRPSRRRPRPTSSRPRARTGPATWSEAPRATLAADRPSGFAVSAAAGSSRRPSAPARTATPAFWVGLGGSGAGSGSDGAAGSGQTGALEQAGTEADCTSGGSASYFAWYELVPAAPVSVGLTIQAGDRVSSRVSVAGTAVTVSITDDTSGQTATKSLTMDNPDTSTAEWIAEAPSSCDQGGNCSPLPLTDFGTVPFTGASATATDGHTGTISDGDWSADAVQLSPGASASGMGGAAVRFGGERRRRHAVRAVRRRRVVHRGMVGRLIGRLAVGVEHVAGGRERLRGRLRVRMAATATARATAVRRRLRPAATARLTPATGPAASRSTSIDRGRRGRARAARRRARSGAAARSAHTAEPPRARPCRHR